MDVELETARTHFDDLLTIAEVARNLNDFRPLDETMSLICERIAGMQACDWVTISLISEAGDTTRSWGDRHIKPEFMSWARSQNAVEKSLKSPVFTAVASGRPVLIPDVQERNDLPALRAGARVQGIRAMAYLPIITRGKALGTMNCYTSTPHRHSESEIDLLQTVARLAGVAAETALIAERQRSTSERLSRLTRELSDRNTELSNLSEAQMRLAEDLSESLGDTVQRVVDRVASELNSSVLVTAADGRARASSGPEAGLAAIQKSLRTRDYAKFPRRAATWPLGAATMVRVGTWRTLGYLVVHPSPSEFARSSLMLLRHTAAILAFEFEVENSDRTLRDLARPNALLALLRAPLSLAQIQALAPLVSLSGEPVRVLVVTATSDAAAGRAADALNHAPHGRSQLVTVAEGPHVISIVRDREGATLEGQLLSLFDEHRLGRWGAGLSGAFHEAADLHAAFQSASAAAAISPGLCKVVSFDALGPAADLLSAIGASGASEYVQRLMGPVIAYDAKHSTELVQSLSSYVENRGSLKLAARALNVHPNTLQLRLRRAAELAGLDLHDPEQLGLVAIALSWHRLTAQAS